jgi:hypothetical protein
MAVAFALDAARRAFTSYPGDFYSKRGHSTLCESRRALEKAGS